VLIELPARLMEHSRMMVFRNGAREEVYISSADWMPRNLDRRVEAAVPIEDPRHRAEIRRLLELMLADRRQVWEMQPDGSYGQRVLGPGEDARGTHAVLVR
jgi:polyphosphate kinase